MLPGLHLQARALVLMAQLLLLLVLMAVVLGLLLVSVQLLVLMPPLLRPATVTWSLLVRAYAATTLV